MVPAKLASPVCAGVSTPAKALSRASVAEATESAPFWIYTPLQWKTIAHLEIRSIKPERAPLPITETGYRSHFHQPEQFGNVLVSHSHAAMGQRYAHRQVIGTPVDVDVPAHGIDRAETVPPRLAAAQPEDARQDPVALRKFAGQRRRKQLARRPPSDEDRALLAAGAYPGPYDVMPAWRATTAFLFARAVPGG